MTMATKTTSKVPSSFMKLPLSLLRFNLSPNDIKKSTQSALAYGKSQMDHIAGITADSRSFESVFLPLSMLDNQLQNKLASQSFLQFVSTSAEVRDASVEATKLIDEYWIEQSSRRDVFEACKTVADSLKDTQSAKGLEPEDVRLIEKTMLSFKHNGLFLSQEDYNSLKEKRKRLADLNTDFSKNMNEDKTEIVFTAHELEGCPKDFLDSLKKSGEGEGETRYVLTMKYPDVFGVLKNARDEQVRKRMDIAFSSKCRDNAALLKEATELRLQCARLLGYENHAEFRLSGDRIAENLQTVLEFENDLKDKLLPKAQEELKILKNMKGEEQEFGSWDYHYYSKKLLEKEYAIDDEAIKEYFPMDHVMKEMISIYQTVLGLKFELLNSQDFGEEEMQQFWWHTDVQLYRVNDAESGKLVGFVYLDLFPRDGKYTHAACFPMISGCQVSGNDATAGERQLPISAMVANFTKPTSDRPSLLKHDEVVTLFHELGHAMHGMCAVTKHARFHGTSVETDFVEAPSQMLENWCWDKEMLQKISRHYVTGDSLPDNTIDQLVKVKQFNSGLTNLRQIFFGLFDMSIHGSAPLPANIPDFYADLRKKITLIGQPEGVDPASSFGHMMGGYDAGYYGYMWSQVFSADMFYTRFQAEGLLNTKVGADYRHQILGPGGSRDGMKSLVEFLGRKPTNDAFLRSIGL